MKLSLSLKGRWKVCSHVSIAYFLLLHHIEYKYMYSFSLTLLITGILTRVTRVISRTGTAYLSAAREFTSGFEFLNLVSSVVLYRPLFVLFLWPLHSLSFDLRLLITPLVPSNVLCSLHNSGWRHTVQACTSI